MGGHDSGSTAQFNWFTKHFNSVTITGRKNCVLVTYATIFGLVLYYKYGKKKPAVTEN